MINKKQGRVTDVFIGEEDSNSKLEYYKGIQKGCNYKLGLMDIKHIMLGNPNFKFSKENIKRYLKIKYPFTR